MFHFAFHYSVLRPALKNSEVTLCITYPRLSFTEKTLSYIPLDLSYINSTPLPLFFFLDTASDSVIFVLSPQDKLKFYGAVSCHKLDILKLDILKLVPVTDPKDF